MTPGHVFTTSSPASRPDWCDSVGTWRVAHLDRFRELVQAIDADAYVAHHQNTPSGRLQLFASLRDNRDPVSHAHRAGVLLARLKAHGFRVRAATDWDGVIVTDRGLA